MPDRSNCYFGISHREADRRPYRIVNVARVSLQKTQQRGRIKIHGLRQTCATFLLQLGRPDHVVSERLGHSKMSMPVEVYAHVLPEMPANAASKLGMLLYG